MKLRVLTAACLAALCLCLPAAAAGEDPSGTAPPTGAETVTAELRAELFQKGSLNGAYTRPGPMALADWTEEELYQIIYQGLAQAKGTIDLSELGIRVEVSQGSIDPDCEGAQMLKRTFEAVTNDHPELFFVTGWWSYNASYRDGGYTVDQLTPEYDTELLAQRDDFEDRVDEVVAQTGGMDALEKALFFHDWLVENVAYNWAVANGQEADADVHSAYSALVRGDAVCEGYALAYNVLLRECGIGCAIVVSRPMNHAWSLVELDGGWYHVDPTWDDPTPDLPGYCGHDNFLRSDEGIRATKHYGWEDPGVQVSTDEPEGIFRQTDNRIYRYGGRWYYLEIDSRTGALYRADSLTDPAAEPVAERLRFFAHRFPNGSGYSYYPNFGVVWDGGAMYYVAEEGRSLSWINLSDGSGGVLGEIPFTASASAQGEYEPELDGIGLYYDDGQIVAVSRTRPEVILARFQPAALPDYPPAWDGMPGGVTAIAGGACTEEGVQIGLVWAEEPDAPAPWLAAAFYSDDGRLIALRTVDTQGLERGLNVLELAGDRLPGGYGRAAFFLLEDGAWRPLAQRGEMG